MGLNAGRNPAPIKRTAQGGPWGEFLSLFIIAIPNNSNAFVAGIFGEGNEGVMGNFTLGVLTKSQSKMSHKIR